MAGTVTLDVAQNYECWEVPPGTGWVRLRACKHHGICRLPNLLCQGKMCVLERWRINSEDGALEPDDGADNDRGAEVAPDTGD